MLFGALGFNWAENTIHATPKSGLVYEGWGKINEKVSHPFPADRMGMHYCPWEMQNSILESGRFNVVEDDVDPKDVDADYDYQRENFYDLIEKGQDAIQGILNVAKESDHPRGYEVAGNLIKQVAEVTEKLGDLQEKMKRLKEVPNSAPKNVTNALFVGSTAELQKMLKGKKDE